MAIILLPSSDQMAELEELKPISCHTTGVCSKRAARIMLNVWQTKYLEADFCRLLFLMHTATLRSSYQEQTLA